MEKRIARVIWNNNGWVKPSGINGKSRSLSTHEGKYQFGHDEWLFDFSKIINGYHYAFLEPIRKNQSKYLNRLFNIKLYTINSKTKNRYLIGALDRVSVIGDEEAKEIYEYYIREGWIDEMTTQLKESKSDWKQLGKWKNADLFNIKFKLEDCHIFDPMVDLELSSPIYKQSRYTLLHEYDSSDFETNYDDNFSFESGMHQKKFKRKSKRDSKENSIEIDLIHNEISENLYKYLVEVSGTERVAIEHTGANKNQRIDLVLKNNDHMIFYEIKTYPSLLKSIREAIGQLLEYNHFSDINLADELIVVSFLKPSAREVKYMENLRTLYEIPIYYQLWDGKKLQDKI